MAASSKPTAVHFTLVAFVMISLILSVVAYLFFRDYRDAQATAQDVAEERDALQRAVDNRESQIQSLKTLLGYPNNAADPRIDNDDAGTVIAALSEDMAALGGPQAGDTLKDTLTQMRTELDALRNQVQSLDQGLATNRDEKLALQQGAENRVEEIRSSQQESEQQLQANITSHEEELAEKNAEIQQLEEDYRIIQSEREELRDEFDRARREWEEREDLLISQVDFLQQQVQELTKVFFDRADGRIVRVDNTTRTVWINLGSADNLREQVTFSVYTQDHRGVGREVEDIKAKIEVTDILGPHMAQARILEEDLDRPIADDDPIYSPLWAAGHTEYFALVGRPDFDNDGEGEWELFREIVQNAGAEVELIVTEEGLREPADAKLSARTKFLIVGDTDDPADFAGQPDRQELAQRVLDEQQALRDEARLYGIRVVRLNDFLEYIGYKPQQRLWQPGENRPFNLRAGARSAGVDESVSNRQSTGTTSELFRDNRSRTSRESSGTTSGLYRN